MEIDNFNIFRENLTFLQKTDRYIIHILRRPKDFEQDSQMRAIGANEHQRLLRTYYVDSLEYFDRKIPAIKELCSTAKARAYILPQVRNNEECLLGLASKVIETIQKKNYSVKPEHLLRSAYCENHKSRDKRWIIDLDKDCMKEPIILMGHGVKDLTWRKWKYGEVLEFVKAQLSEIDAEGEPYMVPTKNGVHIVTPPFNLQKAAAECALMFEGERTFQYQVPCGLGEYETKNLKTVGWLHKDGMSLLYCNLEGQ